MIAVAVFTEPTSENACGFLLDDIHIENISSEDYLSKEDFDYLELALSEFDMKNLKAYEWYQLTFKRYYEDYGEGGIHFSGFEFMEIIKVTQYTKSV